MNETQNKVRKKLSSNADFGKHMKSQRFKELSSVVPKIMEDLTLKDKVMTGGNSNHMYKCSTIIGSIRRAHLIFSSLMRA